MKRIYFDNAATTPLDPEVKKYMLEIMDVFGNPSSIHQEGRMAKTIIEKSRKSISKLLGVSPGEIIFTSSGTEADNMAIRCCVEDLGVQRIISSRIEHHAVLHTLDYFSGKGINISYVNLLDNGHVDLVHLEKLLSETKTKTLVTLMHANNEIGNLLDLENTGELCEKYNAFFHCDTVQTIGHLPIEVKKSKIHFLSASGHKFNGPKGIGFIFIDENVKVRPMIHGGSQERNMRGGTENIFGIAAMAKALEIAYNEMEHEHKHIQELKTNLKDLLIQNFEGIRFNGDYNGDSSFTILNVAFPTTLFSDMILFNLDIEGVSVSGGSACTSGSDQGSHVLKALKLNEGYQSVRFSFGKFNSLDEVELLISKLKIICDANKVLI